MENSVTEPAVLNIEKEVQGGECDLKTNDETCRFENGLCFCVEEFRKEKCQIGSDNIVLPSSINDREEIYYPCNISKDDPSIYGKWLIFTKGHLYFQDHLWVQLQHLLKSGEVTLLESSTAKKCDDRGPFQGIIKCYTSKDINVIRDAGVAIQNILNQDIILDYKTNKASQGNLYRKNGNRFITTFMITANGKMYKRDKLSRWIQIPDAEYQNFMFEENDSQVSLYPKRVQSVSNIHDSKSLPSRESRKKHKRYIYPDEAHLTVGSNVWCLFCDSMDTDNNGLTELDRAWNVAKNLRDEEFFRCVTCETSSYKHQAFEVASRRTVWCELSDFDTNNITIRSADKLRERLSYNMPMYLKTYCLLNRRPKFKSRFLYTEDKELYEYIDEEWKLVK